ncbi:MAG TPA: hypothetical protein VKZ63_21825 [Kofleriaceae bacterium]|nr:hypothetical protein [Kofleriaceae bacterium]
MRFHLPSFLLGCAVGAGATKLAPHVRPLMVEIAAAGYRLVDGVRARVARRREDLSDVVAEARARARGWRPPPRRSRRPPQPDAELRVAS